MQQKFVQGSFSIKLTKIYHKNLQRWSIDDFQDLKDLQRKRARSLVVSDLHSETKGSRF